MMKEVIPFANNPLYRFLFGWAMPPEISLMKYFETETTRILREKYSVTQDMLMPISKLKDSLDYFDENFSIYPLWLCPMAIPESKNGLGLIHPYQEKDNVDIMFVDIGAYGIGSVKDFDGETALRSCEQFVIENDGYQAMYAKTFLTELDFRKMFDHSYYDQLRSEISLARKAFPDMYDKLSSKARVAPVAFKKTRK
jgi:delta24-sterol reductase